MNKTYTHSSEVKEELNNLLDEYCYMKVIEETERKNALDKKRIEIKELTNKVYDYLNYEIMLDLVRGKLPLRVKLFNKISVIGFGIEDDNRIFANIVFNDKYNYDMEMKFSAKEISEKLKLNLE